MPINIKYKAKYECGEYYHVFNRTSASQLMFREEENYRYFLYRFRHYLSPYINIVAWCLIPNHFHFLIQIKEEENFPLLERKLSPNKIITRQFKNFFISYSISLKNRYNLSGNVFSQKYKHIRLYTNKDIRQVVLYIHRNPKHHEVGYWKNYTWSSYQELELEHFSNFKTGHLSNFFDNLNDFKVAHKEYIEQVKGSES